LSESRTRQALRKLRDAGKERRLANAGGPSSDEERAAAARLEAEAVELNKPVGVPVIRSGEVLAMPETPDESEPPHEIKNTLRDPDQAAIDASVARTNLLLQLPADVAPLAIDAAASVNADNSLEKMLTHQLGAAHDLTMKTAARACEFEKRRGMYGEGFQQQDSVELARLSNSVARLMTAFQQGLLTLQRLKTGTSQIVTVRHVTVQAGGQAVIGNVKPGGRARRRRRRGGNGK
jgi:hypothetical protein